MSDVASAMTPGQERRLAAVLFTDVAGYSARMQRDEVGTLALVRDDFARIEALCANHGGTILNRMGDGMLLCFSSVVQAVMCALAIQTLFAERRKTQPAEQCLEHRIGVHLGDIFLHDGQVAGDGVNIAARLQTRAAPGGICISQTVHDTVKGKIGVQAVALGPHDFKNIAEPIAIFHLAPEGGPTAPAAAPAAKKSGRRPRRLAVAGVAVATLAAAAYFVARYARPPAAGGPDAGGRLAIAVLPFANMSADPANAYFVDGVHEDILASLTHVDDFAVISQRSVMPYRGTAKPTRVVAQELKVSHVLEGSVRRAGNSVRMSAKLIDAKTDRHVWAENYDRELNNVFAIQTEIATKIAQALHATLAPHETAHLSRAGTASVDASESYHRGRDVFHRAETVRDIVSQALPWFERAVEHDPNYVDAWAEIARVHLLAYASFEPTAARLARARAAIDAAVKIKPDDPAVFLALADFETANDEFAAAATNYRKIIATYPNHVAARTGLSEVAQRLGQWAEALNELRQARTLDPRGPETLSNLSNLLVRVRRFDEAEAVAREVVPLMPPSALRAFQIALIRFHAHGVSADVADIIAGLPAEALRTDSNAVSITARWAAMRGDADELLRVWRESGSNWRFNPGSARLDIIAVAAAHLARNDAAAARALLDPYRGQLEASAAANATDAAVWCDLALTRAMLGDPRGALASADRARELAAALPDVIARTERNAELARVYAWAGDKRRALHELADVLRQPATVAIANVHELKQSLLWRPLQAEPEFQALLAAAPNNAPLL